MRVMLIRPPQKFYNAKFPRGPRTGLPVGLIAIGGFLERHGVEVKIFDAIIEDATFKDQGEDRPVHFGSSWDDVREAIESWRPDIVGVSNIFYETMEDSTEVARIARRAAPEASIIFGGPNATAQVDHLMEHTPEIDFICVGDGENAMLELVEWRNGERELDTIGNLVWRKDGVVTRNAARHLPMNLDPLGKLDFSLVPMDKYYQLEGDGILARNRFHCEGAERSVSVVTSRGCPYFCSFCSIHIHAGRKYRTYTADYVVDQIDDLVTNHGVTHIHFEDDNLTLDQKRFMAIMDGVIERNLKFTWDTPNGVHANTLSEEMMIKMKQTGCIYLIIAVESADQWVLDNVIHKTPLKVENIMEAFKVGKRIGLDLQAFYIIGFPRETMTQIMTTMNFALNSLIEYDVVPHLAQARADYGTDLFDEAERMGALVRDHAISNTKGVHIDRFIRHMIKTDEFNPEQLDILNNAYHHKFMVALAKKAALFSLSHPLIAMKNAGWLFEFMRAYRMGVKQAAVFLFFTRLSYPHALRAEARGQIGPAARRTNRRREPAPRLAPEPVPAMLAVNASSERQRSHAAE